jgi:hypothetical protein
MYLQYRWDVKLMLASERLCEGVFIMLLLCDENFRIVFKDGWYKQDKCDKSDIDPSGAIKHPAIHLRVNFLISALDISKRHRQYAPHFTLLETL